MWHQCNLSAKESRLECACVNNDDFTVLVSGSSRWYRVSVCTVWLSHSKWASRTKNLHQVLHEAWTFLCGNCSDDSGGCSCGQLVTGSFIVTTPPPMHHVLCRAFWQNIKSPSDSAPLRLRFGALQILAFPKTKITFEREEISNHWWDSGKYYQATDGDGENCVRSQGAYFEWDWGVIVLCAVLLVSCIFFNKCFYFSYYMTGYLLDRLCICEETNMRILLREKNN